MEFVLGIIGFIIGLLIALLAASNIVLTVFKQIPFMNKLKRLGVFREGNTFLGYYIRILISLAVLGGMLMIPFGAVTWGVLFGIFVALRGLFDSSLKNDMYVDFVNGIESTNADVDPDKWQIFSETVKGIDVINNFITRKSYADLENARNHYGLDDSQIQKYSRLTVEGNKVRERMVQIFTAMRDELLANDSSLWEKIAEKYDTSEIDKLEASIQDITEQQQDILEGYQS